MGKNLLDLITDSMQHLAEDIWKMFHPHIVLDELMNFNENLLETTDKEIIKTSKELIEQ